jgi:hypothetical protein
MTKNELKGKLWNFPRSMERRRAELAASLAALLADKAAVSDGIRAANWDGMPHGSTISDPTAQTVLALERGFSTEISLIANEIWTIGEEIRLIQSALKWLQSQPNGPQMYSIVYLRYLRASGWNRASRDAHYSWSGARKTAERAVELMAQWTRR